MPPAAGGPDFIFVHIQIGTYIQIGTHIQIGTYIQIGIYPEQVPIASRHTGA